MLKSDVNPHFKADILKEFLPRGHVSGPTSRAGLRPLSNLGGTVSTNGGAGEDVKAKIRKSRSNI